MKFTITHKAVSIALAFLVLFSTMSFTVEKHYCGDYLIDIAIFSDANKCGGMDTEEALYVKKPCCKDTVDILKGQDELKTADFKDLDKAYQLTLIAYVYSYEQLFESLPKQIIHHKDYSPPNLIKDIQVVNESFLI